MDPTIGRLLSPTGFVLVGLLLFLPFLTLGCDEEGLDGQRITYSVTYSGADLVVGGEPDLRLPKETGAADGAGADEDPFGPEPFAVVAAVLLVVGAGAGLLPWVRWRPRVAAAAAFLSGIGLLAAVLRTENRIAEALDPLRRQLEEPSGTIPEPPQVDIFDHFQLRYGFWLAVVALTLLGFGNVLAAVPTKKKTEEVPA